MTRFVLYNDDAEVAVFNVQNTIVTDFQPLKPELLPMQIRKTSADGFTAWLRERAVDLNNAQHRNLMNELVGSRDKVTLALKTHMFSISDTFTCFEEGTFVPRKQLCSAEDQDAISDYILVSSDTSLRNLHVATPNASTDGSFTKTWKWENDAWWLYKIQSVAATEAEVEISKVLQNIGWNAAEYDYAGADHSRVKTRNFLKDGEFFEPYDSFRFFFDNPSDDENVITQNISSLGAGFEESWKRIVLADALFENTDRHMRNFGVIRSSMTGETLRLAPNFDNNQAYLANPSGRYAGRMLEQFMKKADERDRENLKLLCAELITHPYLSAALEAAQKWL